MEWMMIWAVAFGAMGFAISIVCLFFLIWCVSEVKAFNKSKYSIMYPNYGLDDAFAPSPETSGPDEKKTWGEASGFNDLARDPYDYDLEDQSI